MFAVKTHYMHVTPLTYLMCWKNKVVNYGIQLYTDKGTTSFSCNKTLSCTCTYPTTLQTIRTLLHNSQLRLVRTSSTHTGTYNRLLNEDGQIIYSIDIHSNNTFVEKDNKTL